MSATTNECTRLDFVPQQSIVVWLLSIYKLYWEIIRLKVKNLAVRCLFPERCSQHFENHTNVRPTDNNQDLCRSSTPDR